MESKEKLRQRELICITASVLEGFKLYHQSRGMSQMLTLVEQTLK